MEVDRSSTRSSYSSGCVATPAWFPAAATTHRVHFPFQLLRRAGSLERSRSWRSVLKRLLKEGKSIYCSKPLAFGYDEDSYFKNFDDGLRNEGSADDQIFHDLRD